MAIEFDCPHCGLHYRLKDDLAGKAATCRNCREKIRIPQPVMVPDDTPLPIPPVDAEAAALAALADEPKVEQDSTTQVIDVECNYCGRKWTEPLARAGKNMLCPECKQRVRIPEPKDEGQYDWRHRKSKLPEGAKQNQEKLEGVQDAGDAKLVSGKALKDADALGEELEPRPLKQKVMFALIAVGLVAGLVFGSMYLMRSRTEGKEDRLMQNAEEEFAQSTDTLPKEEVPLDTAVLHIAAGEHALRHDTKEKLKEAMEHFAKAQSALRPINSPARNAILGELAVSLLSLGGTDAQISERIRIRWTPEMNARVRPNEQIFTVYEELRKLLSLAQAADAEFRKQLTRRLARELIKRGQAGMALDLLPLALSSQTIDRTEAKAVIALEVYRADKSSKLPSNVAEELAKLGPALAKSPAPSVETLFRILKMEKTPFVVTKPSPGNGGIPESTRYAYAGLALLEDKPADALALAQRPSQPEGQFRALVLCAEWSTDSGPALDAAYGLISTHKNSKSVTLSPYLILRLAEIAATNGKIPQAKQFADAMPDDGSKAWAHGQALRLQLAAAPNTKGEENGMALPDDPKKIRAGHAWGRMWLARQNSRISGDRSGEIKIVNAWPTPLGAFGKAGIALGLQDRDK